MAALAGDVAVSDRLKLLLDIEHVAKDVTEPAALQLLPAAQGRVPSIPDPRTNFGGENLRYAARATNWLGRADYRLSGQLALTLEYGEARTARDRDFSQLESYGGANGQGVLRVFRTRDQRYRNRNARGELAAAFATGPIRHDLIVGATSNWRFQNGRNGTALTVAQSFVDPRDARRTVAAHALRDRPAGLGAEATESRSFLGSERGRGPARLRQLRNTGSGSG